MSDRTRKLCLFLGVWACLVFALAGQAWFDLRSLGPEIRSQEQDEAALAAEILRSRLYLDWAWSGSESVDEVIARPLVFAAMEDRRLVAAAIFAPDRPLEAQQRLADGSLSPMVEALPAGSIVAERTLEHADRPIARVMIALDPGPGRERLASLARQASIHLVGLSCVCGLVVLILFWLDGRKRGVHGEKRDA